MGRLRVLQVHVNEAVTESHILQRNRNDSELAGEVLDIDGPTGGYNLSLAFATARLAVSPIKPLR